MDDLLNPVSSPPARRRAPRVVIALMGVASVATSLLAFAAAPASAAPPSARSYYVSGYSLSWAYDRGCDAGTADKNTAGTQTHYVVLDFGSLYKNSVGTWTVSGFGHPFSLAKARDMVQQWAYGYWTCTGTDTASTAYVGLGTNNSAGEITSAAGLQFANTAQSAVNWAKSHPSTSTAAYAQGRPAGANDFEDFNVSNLNTKSRNWIDGYNSASSRPMMLNYGAASGCPTSFVPSAGSCNASLNAETIWRVSWGPSTSAAFPLPEIYSTSGSNAKQWRYLSRYSYNEHGSAFRFQGVMAQSGACSQRGGCTGTDNTPSEAWSQLDAQVSADPITDSTVGPPTNIWWK